MSRLLFQSKLIMVRAIWWNARSCDSYYHYEGYRWGDELNDLIPRKEWNRTRHQTLRNGEKEEYRLVTFVKNSENRREDHLLITFAGGNNKVLVYPEEWLIKDEIGRYYKMSDKLFRLTYEDADQDSRRATLQQQYDYDHNLCDCGHVRSKHKTIKHQGSRRSSYGEGPCQESDCRWGSAPRDRSYYGDELDEYAYCKGFVQKSAFISMEKYEELSKAA